jgi:hypothetical protein
MLKSAPDVTALRWMLPWRPVGLGVRLLKIMFERICAAGTSLTPFEGE